MQGHQKNSEVVVAVFTLKTVLTSIQYLLFLTLQGKETNFRGKKLTQNTTVQKNKIKIKYPEKVPTLARRYDTQVPKNNKILSVLSVCNTVVVLSSTL